MRCYLGVDGGGTKTAFALVGEDGRLLARHEARSSYYLGTGVDLVGEVLAEGVGAVCAAAGVRAQDVTRAFFGLPAYGEVSADVPALDAAPAAVLGHDRYDCDNDMVAGWAGSLGGADGINVVAGTGSMTYGERDGVGVRVGGWGEAFGDEGSAHWVAVRGLQLASRQADGRAGPGPMLDVLVEHLGLDAPLDLVDVVLNRWGAERGRVASLAPVVVRAARAGDRSAASVLEAAADELVLLVTTTAARLGRPEEGADGWGAGGASVPVSCSGGLFRAREVLDGLRAGLRSAAGGFELRRPQLSPV
ncbi:BadF/BadG/BcrA/BcrD ATPase family protein, partial [Pseudokineococcus basanitobsidens]